MAFDPDDPHPETRANFALMEADDDAMHRFWRLAVETSNYQRRLKEIGALQYPSWVGVAEAAILKKFIIPRIPPEHHDHDLFRRWESWGDEYESLYSASPKWRLKEMISEVSETVSRRSWPNRWERDVWEWAVSPKQGEDCPFHRYRHELDEAFRERLQALVADCDGFLYMCEESLQVVYAPTAELPNIWRHQDHLAAIDRAKPFGFFHDAGRPDYWKHMRAPTDEEELVMEMGRKGSKPGSKRPAIERLRDWLSNAKNRGGR